MDNLGRDLQFAFWLVVGATFCLGGLAGYLIGIAMRGGER